jgi:hypothetical protein
MNLFTTARQAKCFLVSIEFTLPRKKSLLLKTAFGLMLSGPFIPTVSAQVGVGTLTPHASAQLDVTSDTKGVLVSRMTSAQRIAIASPADGLLVYDTDTKGFWYHKTGTGWTQLNNAPLSLPYVANENNSNTLFSITNQGSGNILSVTSSGNGAGVRSFTGGGFAVHGVTSSQSSAGVVGNNNGAGEAVVGLTTSDIAGAVVGRNDGGGYGVRGFIANNTSGTGIGVFGQVGMNGSTGRAGRFENYNKANTGANTLEVQTNSDGNIPDRTKGNAASFVVDNTNSVAAAVRGEVKTMYANFGAAGLFGVSSGTGGYAGLFHASNTAGNGAALAAVSDGNGNAIVANAKNAGNGVAATADGTGNAINAWTPTNSNGRAARFANFNTANTNAVLTAETYSIGDIALFKSGNPTTANVARIDATGKGFFNGGTQSSGADLAEAFDVIKEVSEYEPGDILSIAITKDRTVEKSNGAYSSLVLGVYATKPGILLTEENIDSDLTGKVPMGVVGVIPTKVCHEGGAIRRGDLLVTSSIPGVAMKADPARVQPGQIIGKALQNFDDDQIGKINVFVNVK